MVVYFEPDYKNNRISSLAGFTINAVLLVLGFALCLSFSTGVILVVFRHRAERTEPAISLLPYFVIFFNVFGYYTLWSQILIEQFLQGEDVERITTLVAQLGVPFYLIGMILFLSWIAKLKKISVIWLVALTFVASLILFAGFVFQQSESQSAIRLFWTAFGTAAAGAAAISLGIGEKQLVLSQWRTLFKLAIVLTGVINLSYLTSFSNSPIYDPIYAVVFFLGNTIIAVSYCYWAEPEKSTNSFEEFLAKFGITSREMDVVNGIYAGKTNKEIADSLFITVQTVKDHSSRIYQKAQVKNRAQLAALLRSQLS